MLAYLKDDDPEVVLQSIRGLLPFLERTLKEQSNGETKERQVRRYILSLGNHPNETVREFVAEIKNKENRPQTPVPAEPLFPPAIKDKVVCGDVLQIAKKIPNESIHLTFTSPPYYNARDYSIYKSYEEYLTFLKKVFRQLHRITKEGRFFILNTSPIIIPRISRSHASKRYPIPYDLHPIITKLGWEFIDDIVWALSLIHI